MTALRPWLPFRRAAPFLRSGRSWARRQMAGSGGKPEFTFGGHLANLRQKPTSGSQSGPATHTDTVVSPPGTSERGPLPLVPCLVGIFDRLNRLDVFGNILRRQAGFPATCEDKVLVPAIGFEAVVDVIGRGEIGKDLPPATFVVDDRDHRVLVAAADAFGLI